jgi:hypothetical protein
MLNLAMLFDGARFSTFTGSGFAFCICSLSPDTRLAQLLARLLLIPRENTKHKQRKPSQHKKNLQIFLLSLFVLHSFFSSTPLAVVSALSSLCTRLVAEIDLLQRVSCEKRDQASAMRRQNKMRQSILLWDESFRQNVQIRQVSGLALMKQERNRFAIFCNREIASVLIGVRDSTACFDKKTQVEFQQIKTKRRDVLLTNQKGACIGTCGASFEPIRSFFARFGRGKTCSLVPSHRVVSLQKQKVKNKKKEKNKKNSTVKDWSTTMRADNPRCAVYLSAVLGVPSPTSTICHPRREGARCSRRVTLYWQMAHPKWRNHTKRAPLSLSVAKRKKKKTKKKKKKTLPKRFQSERLFSLCIYDLQAVDLVQKVDLLFARELSDGRGI